MKSISNFCLLLVLSCYTLVGCTNSPVTQTNDHPAPPVFASAASLLDANTGEILYSKNASVHLPIFSTTKLMTALVTVEHGNLDQRISIDAKIVLDLRAWLSPDSSLMGLQAGETYTLRELLEGLLLPSGNDAAVAIADAVAGSVPAFVALMNQKATEIGMHDTHFTNPHGLPYTTHYSSAYDLAILGKASLSDQTLQQISATKEIKLAATHDHHAYDMINGNQFLWWYPGVDGGKPGYDGDKNFNQVISCTHNGHHLIGVVLGTQDWWTDMRDLMNWGFNTYTWVSPRDFYTSGHPIPYADLWNNFAGDTKESTIPTTDNGRYYIYTGYSIAGDIENYFDTNGGLPSFGFPLSQPDTSAQDTFRQRFEHGTIICSPTCSRITS